MIGIVNVYKPSGITSFGVVSRLKKIYNTKQVGHLGTLDPLAEGVLPIAIGKATKLFDYYLNKDKEYIATFRCGEETNTLDSEGVVVKTINKKITMQEFNNAIKKFVGEIEQTPPKYSAIKINGRRAYELARKGESFEIKSKKIKIYELDSLKQPEEDLFKLKIKCSSGTYIRSLGRDIFYSMGNLCTMIKLIRTKAGNFDIKDSKTIEDIQNDPQGSITSIEDSLDNLEQFTLPIQYFKQVKNGVQVEAKGLNAPSGLFLLYIDKILMGVAEIVSGKIVLKINLYEGE